MKTVAILFLFSTVGGIAYGQASVEVSRAVFAEIPLGQRVVGTVRPLRTSVVGSALDGRVLEFNVNAGDAVEEGQQLAQLRTETLEIQLAAAQAQLELSRQELAELENGSLPETIAEAEANRASAEALKENAATKLKRLESLIATRAASEADLEDAREQAAATRYALVAAEASLKRVRDGPRKELIAQAQARVELQTQNVNLLKDQIEKLTISSPFNGHVAAEFTEVGSWISRGDPIAQIVQLDEIEIEVPVTAEYAVRLRPGDSIRVEFPELPDQLFIGTVDRVVPATETRARTFPVYVRMPNRFRHDIPLLMAGMLARVELPAGRRETMPLVPKDALVLSGDERSVFVIQPESVVKGGKLTGSNGKAVKVPVDLGVAIDGFIQIRGDITEGDLVVVTGNERLLPGATVKITQVHDDSPTLPLLSAE